MHPKGAQYGVADPDLTAKGVKGLRIVDASVPVSTFLLSNSPPTNPAHISLAYLILAMGFTMTTAYLVAERASDMIKVT